MASSTAAYLRNREWVKDDYYITTNHKKIPLEKLNDAFASPTCYWAKSLPLSVLEETFKNLNLLLRDLWQLTKDTDKPTKEEFIGFARCVTDFTTFSYLTERVDWSVTSRQRTREGG